MDGDFTQKVQEAIFESLQTEDVLTEQLLADKLGVSRTPVRDALNILEAQGLVVRKKNSGIRLHQPSLRDLVEVYDLRIALEGMAARILATHGDARTIRELEVLSQKHSRLRESKKVDDDELGQSDRIFHQTLIDQCGNRHLKRVANSFHVLSRSFSLTDKLCANGELKKFRYTHEQIVKALIARDAGNAELLTRMHIQEAKEEIISAFVGPTYVKTEPVLQGAVT